MTGRPDDGAPVLPDALIRQVQDYLPRARAVSSPTVETPIVPVGSGPLSSGAGGSGLGGAVPLSDRDTLNALPGPGHDPSLRSRVHATLDERVRPGDSRDNVVLVDLVTEALDLTELERLSATNYVHTWRQDMDSGRRVNAR